MAPTPTPTISPPCEPRAPLKSSRGEAIRDGHTATFGTSVVPTPAARKQVLCKSLGTVSRSNRLAIGTRTHCASNPSNGRPCLLTDCPRITRVGTRRTSRTAHPLSGIPQINFVRVELSARLSSPVPDECDDSSCCANRRGGSMGSSNVPGRGFRLGTSLLPPPPGGSGHETTEANDGGEDPSSPVGQVRNTRSKAPALNPSLTLSPRKRFSESGQKIR